MNIRRNKISPLDESQIAQLNEVEKRLIRHKNERLLLRRERSDILKVRRRIENDLQSHQGFRENTAFIDTTTEATFSNKEVRLILQLECFILLYF